MAVVAYAIEAKRAIEANDPRRTAWVMSRLGPCRAMLLFHTTLEKHVWSGYSWDHLRKMLTLWKPLNSYDSMHPPRRVGLFWVDGTENKGGAVFLYTSSSFLNRHGIVYVPPGQATPSIKGRVNEQLVGPWHSFTWRF